ncbi:flagellar hook-associated protein FlgL [Niallia sp. Krafla_26]|uniref:flagellar hook-associated protein FlgL n=1 Tax=Niallia sp. Krafla_26 TaxID=3064703 RepID=UPI003D177B6C
MRVTQSMVSNNMLSNLSRSYDKIADLQNQISNQKKINRPSDDPVVAMKGITYRRNVQEVEQYKRNFSEAYNWIDNSDASLDQAGQALQRMRELIVQASNDTYDLNQRKSISEEIGQLKEQLIEIANTKVGDKYIFNGTDTLNPPVDKFGNVISENQKGVQLELAKGVYINVNINPKDVFGQELFDNVEDLIASLNDPTSTGEEINAFLTDMDDHIASVNNSRAELGSRYNRVELMENRIDQQEIIVKQKMSENEDVDFEKVVTEMLAQESVHRAALSVGARVIQPTLMDFLR